MTESHIFQPPPNSNNMNNSFFDHVKDQEEEFYFPMEDSSFSTPYLDQTVLLNDGYEVDFQDDLDDMDIISTDNISEYLKDPILDNGEISTDISIVTSAQENREGLISDQSLDMISSVILPAAGMEIDNELGAFHLLMAYAEAMEMGQEELAEVIGKRIGEKVSPIGDTLERLMYYVFQNQDKQTDYLKQESLKNFHQAFKAFYQIFPNGKFAHFVANLAILEALPKDNSKIHIFDFDIGEGIQWASLIGAIINGSNQVREVILTSIKLESDGSSNNPLFWKFEDTKKRLCDYARPYELKLKVKEVELAHLGSELTSIQEEKGKSRDWFVFNCMIGLPHMARIRSRKDVLDFLESAQDIFHENRGIIIFGDGGCWEKVKNASNYGTFLDGNMGHYQALLESIKLNFPVHLGDARTAMECLFVAPLVSSFEWAKKWEEKKKYGNLEMKLKLKGWKLSQESLMEAKEVVREGESLYGVRIEGERNNEMVMDWRGIPMVKVSCWKR
ncbi:hypothetical protein M9H77_22576 [Catharanthus roseus]|uniref:Uncharacterized protein n=1 Tax=Catharanthus roseus TaxID=4058 RepID=A0ACC0AQK5_CATRO|nr:hypothetical protein M9H77_22576 [Catharanthus roseus]